MGRPVALTGPDGPRIELLLESTARSVDGQATVLFSATAMGASAPVEAETPTGHGEGEVMTDPVPAELALAIAEDAATALGGELQLVSNDPRRPVGRVRLTQPSLPE